ncbi:MAG: hypothetical protein ACFB4I_04275 [Cyanophyceae cyanobacterium]
MRKVRSAQSVFCKETALSDKKQFQLFIHRPLPGLLALSFFLKVNNDKTPDESAWGVQFLEQ